MIAVLPFPDFWLKPSVIGVEQKAGGKRRTLLLKGLRLHTRPCKALESILGRAEDGGWLSSPCLERLGPEVSQAWEESLDGDISVGLTGLERWGPLKSETFPDFTAFGISHFCTTSTKISARIIRQDL